MVKELVFFGGNPEGFVPPLVASALEEKFKHRRSGK
jgi:phosphopantetheine adenylyltransferase